jgi:hypothetical protein
MGSAGIRSLPCRQLRKGGCAMGQGRKSGCRSVATAEGDVAGAEREHAERRGRALRMG